MPDIITEEQYIYSLWDEAEPTHIFIRPVVDGRFDMTILLDMIEQRYKGNRDAMEMLFCSLMSANPIYPNKLNIAFNGMSDVGKSTGMEAILELVDESHQYHSRAVSPKVIFYESEKKTKKMFKRDESGNLIKDENKESIMETVVIQEPTSFKNKVVFLDDVDFKDAPILKQLANTIDRTPSYTTLTDGIVKKFSLDARPVVWTTKVELFNDLENQTDRRFFKVELKNNDVREFIRDSMFNPVEQESLNDVKQHLKNLMEWDVKIKCIDGIDISFCNTNTDVKLFLSVVMGITKINAVYDPTLSEITVRPEDVAEAKRLYLTHNIQITNLKESAIKLLNYIPKTIPDLENYCAEGNTLEEIFDTQREALELSLPQVNRLLNSLLKSGKITKLSGKFNRKYYYAV